MGTSSDVSLATILFLMAYIRNNIEAKKTNELVLLFHKNISKLVFLWPNMGQKRFKVLNKRKTTLKNNFNLFK